MNEWRDSVTAGVKEEGVKKKKKALRMSTSQ